MPIYQPAVKRQRNFSFNEGKLKLGNQDKDFGPQNDPNASPVDKAGLVNPEREKKAQQGWKLENEDGSTTDVQGPPQEEAGFVNDKGEFDFSQSFNPDDLDTNQIKALQKKIGAGADGKWGPGSQNKLNTYYAFEGIEPPNARKLQGVLEGMGAVIKEKPDNYDTIGGKKPSYATNELSSGGDVSPKLINTIENYMKPLGIPGLRVTAGNDAYHQGDRYSRPGQGAHSKGNALDFTTDDPQAVRDSLIEQGYKHVETKRKDGSVKYSYYVSPKGKDPKHRILDEYAHATKNTTGGHFDWKVY